VKLTKSTALTTLNLLGLARELGLGQDLLEFRDIDHGTHVLQLRMKGYLLDHLGGVDLKEICIQNQLIVEIFFWIIFGAWTWINLFSISS
jgi:hypothetical protein